MYLRARGRRPRLDLSTGRTRVSSEKGSRAAQPPETGRGSPRSWRCVATSTRTESFFRDLEETGGYMCKYIYIYMYVYVYIYICV